MICWAAIQIEPTKTRSASAIVAIAATCPIQWKRLGAWRVPQRSIGATRSARKTEKTTGMTTTAVARSIQPTRITVMTATQPSRAAFQRLVWLPGRSGSERLMARSRRWS